jgi:hypothetical protein
MDADTVAAMVLGLLLLAACLGGLVWLDAGPVGGRGRDLRHGRPAPDDDTDDGVGAGARDAERADEPSA